MAAIQVLNDLDLQQNQIVNVVIHALASAPTVPAPVDSQMYFNTGDRKLYTYRLSTTTWESVGGGSVVGGNGLAESISGGVVTLSVNVDDSTIEIVTDVLRIKDSGVTAIKLATNAVTTAKVLDAAITYAKIQNVTSMTLLGRTAAGSGVVSEVPLINDNTLATGTATNIATAASIKAYIDGLVAAVGTLIGAFNATSNTIYPGISSTKKGDYWYVSVAGTVQGTVFNVGDVLIANKVNPSTTSAADWIFLETNRDQATTAILGLVFLATNAEVQTGTDANKVVTPASLSARTATESRTGLAAIATTAIVNTGTDDTTIVTPLKMKAYVASQLANGSYAATIGDGTTNTYVVTHGLGTLDVHVQIRRVSDNSVVLVDNRASSTTQITIVASKVVASGALRVIISK